MAYVYVCVTFFADPIAETGYYSEASDEETDAGSAPSTPLQGSREGNIFAVSVA